MVISTIFEHHLQKVKKIVLENAHNNMNHRNGRKMRVVKIGYRTCSDIMVVKNGNN